MIAIEKNRLQKILQTDRKRGREKERIAKNNSVFKRKMGEKEEINRIRKRLALKRQNKKNYASCNCLMLFKSNGDYCPTKLFIICIYNFFNYFMIQFIYKFFLKFHMKNVFINIKENSSLLTSYFFLNGLYKTSVFHFTDLSKFFETNFSFDLNFKLIACYVTII